MLASIASSLSSLVLIARGNSSSLGAVCSKKCVLTRSVTDSLSHCQYCELGALQLS